MDIKRFAQDNKLNFRMDACGDLVIPGKRGHIYDYGGRIAGAVISSSPRLWGNARRAFEDVGIKVIQDGDFEGSAIFSPSDLRQLSLVMRHAGIRKRRQPSQAQLAVLASAREKSLQKPVHGQGSKVSSINA